MSIKLRTVTEVDSIGNQLEADGALNFSSSSTPLTSQDVDNNFIQLKQKIDEIEADYDATFTSSGAVKEGAISTASLGNESITSEKIKDRAVDWSDQRAILYITDTSVKVNEVQATLTDYLSNTGLSSLAENTVLAFKAAADNSSSVKLVLKNKDGSNDATDLISLEIFKQKDVPLSSGDIKEGGFYLVYYDGSTLQLVNSLQDPSVVVEQNISAVSTFGPLLFDLATLGDNTASSQDHLLGARPTTYDAFLVCQTAEHGYAAGDLVPLDSLTSSATVGAPIIVRASSTAITVTKTDEPLNIPNATNGDAATLTPGNWKVEVRGTYREDNTYSPSYVDRSLDYIVRSAHGAITVGNYLYYFHNGHFENSGGKLLGGKHARLRKVNLITNVVIDCGYAGNDNLNHLCNCSYIKYSALDQYQATSGTIISGQGGSNYNLNDILTLASGQGASTTLATFKVTEVINGAVTKVEVANPGDYTSLPNNGDTGVATTVQPAGGSDAKVNVDWEVNFDNRIYWTTPLGQTYYIEVNGTDTAETINRPSTVATSKQFQYNIQEYKNNYFWAFRNRDSRANNIQLYKWQTNSTRTIHQSSKTLDFMSAANANNSTAFRDYESQGYSGYEPVVKCLQWNPNKRRIYVVTRSGFVVHVFTIPYTSLKDWFEASGQPHTHLTYVKTVGIPGGGPWANDSYYDGIHIDIDVSTGEEKSISIANFNTVAGKVTRAAWREG